MENEIQGITAVAAVVLALAGVSFLLQLALWRALSAADIADAPAFLRFGRGLLPSALVALAAVAVIVLLRR